MPACALAAGFYVFSTSFQPERGHNPGSENSGTEATAAFSTRYAERAQFIHQALKAPAEKPQSGIVTSSASFEPVGDSELLPEKPPVPPADEQSNSIVISEMQNVIDGSAGPHIKAPLRANDASA